MHKGKWLFVALAVLALLTACGKAAGPAVTIELLHGQPEEPRVKAIQGIMDDFMAANPKITVKQVPVAEDALWTKITTLIAARQLTAMVEGGLDQLRLMNEEGVINTKANLDVITRHGADNLYQGALAVAKAPGKAEYIGVPVSGWVAGIWYRKDWFADKGLAAPAKWEDILAAAKAINEPAKKRYGIAISTEESDFTTETFQQFALSNGAELFDASGKPTFDSPAMKAAIAFYRDLYRYCPKGSNGVTQVKDAFVGGNAAMAVYSTYIMGALYEQGMADKIGFAVPTKLSAATFGMTSTMTIAAGLKDAQTEAAVKFLDFMLDEKANIPWLHMAAGGANPVVKAIAKNPTYLAHPLLQAFGETAANIPEAFADLKMFGFRDGEVHPKMGTISAKLVIPRAINAILVQGKDLDATVAQAQKELEEIVSQ